MSKAPLLTLCAGLALFVAPVHAALELVEQSTKTVGATTVTWDSSLQDLNYTTGTTLIAEVNWSVDAGQATFSNFRLRSPNFTPKGPDPANGSLSSIQLLSNSGGAGSDGAVQVAFVFSELHCDAERQVQIGNAHFSLDLNIDQNGDGAIDSVVGYGVNVHVEQPGACVATDGGPPGGRGGPPGPIPPRAR